MRALRKQDLRGYAPFLSVSKASYGRVAPFLSPVGGSDRGRETTIHSKISFTHIENRTRECAKIIPERRVHDGRTKRGGEQCNFFVYYEIDEDISKHVLKLNTYGGDGIDSWVLLEEESAPM